MTSEPTVMTNSVSRGTPSSRPPRPMTTWRSARSLMSTTRGQRIPCGSMPSGFLWWRLLSRNAAGEVVGRPDGMDVAGQVEVEVLHRDDLAVAAAGRPALDPEDRPERRLADVDRGLLADVVEALGEPDRGRRLALAERRRGDRGHDHVLAARTLGLEPADRLERDLGLRRPVQLELVVGDPEVAGDVDDRARRDGAGDLEVGREAHRSPRRAADGSVGRPRVASRPAFAA